MAEQRKLRRRLVGFVVSDRMDKTISVRVDRRIQHARYSKVLTRSTVVKAHDEKNEAKTGDQVEVMEIRPISKTKFWRLVTVVRPAGGATAEKKEGAAS